MYDEMTILLAEIDADTDGRKWLNVEAKFDGEIGPRQISINVGSEKGKQAVQHLADACGVPGASDSSEFLGQTITIEEWRKIESLCGTVIPRDATPSAPEGRYIYVISCTDSDGPLCKIGIANEPVKRLRQLSTASPHQLRLEMCRHTEHARTVEGLAHQRFADERRNGEWFALRPFTAICFINQMLDYE